MQIDSPNFPEEKFGRAFIIWTQQIYNALTSLNGTQDIEITTIGKGVIMKSPDGTKWRLTPSNAGTAVFTVVP